MMKNIIINKKVSYEYFLYKKYLAGVKLLGNEVKSIRLGQVNLDNSYVYFEGNELFIFNMRINKYNFSHFFNYEENRKKKLLLHKKEILQIKSQIQIKKMIVVLLRVFSDRNLLKLEIALARAKNKYDRRYELKKKDDELKIKKALKNIQY
ncbi:SsrA-binding protein SmpB [Candidatus Phytoplasma melaleucae]|uniref:SsrA-binding protein n=1 Tax=Candidatus Phytoplasma melaleucae TaxID=2982630 RepID=A0ABT9DDJ7_9MOLU|nr:SsrA-binding protein SmpB ['Melaleuca sp.' phytoplasma]MDO8167948.1 SsrA-binding protein SmpB ['Melaleuca sp.' phytoplasma]MDV3205144.1 SsrA-binding protein SmpB [Weeping tea tree witches'-broom phytoplasma]